jgi:hypothetical protein
MRSVVVRISAFEIDRLPRNESSEVETKTGSLIVVEVGSTAAATSSGKVASKVKCALIG